MKSNRLYKSLMLSRTVRRARTEDHYTWKLYSFRRRLGFCIVPRCCALVPIHVPLSQVSGHVRFEFISTLNQNLSKSEQCDCCSSWRSLRWKRRYLEVSCATMDCHGPFFSFFSPLSLSFLLLHLSWSGTQPRTSRRRRIRWGN